MTIQRRPRCNADTLVVLREPHFLLPVMVLEAAVLLN